MNEKVVLHLKGGKLLKGFLLSELDEDTEEFKFRPTDSDDPEVVRVSELKAVFFVRDFKGDSSYREQKRYGISERIGKRVFIKFEDGEVMLGYLTGELPWERGFYLNGKNSRRSGFYVVPVDRQSNNIKVFVSASSIKDVTVI